MDPIANADASFIVIAVMFHFRRFFLSTFVLLLFVYCVAFLAPFRWWLIFVGVVAFSRRIWAIQQTFFFFFFFFLRRRSQTIAQQVIYIILCLRGAVLLLGTEIGLIPRSRFGLGRGHFSFSWS